MKIAADQIEKKAIAGKTKDGNPIVYIATKGGLHAFFMKDEDGTISSIGAAPHRAIAKFLAGKKADIEWKEDFHKSEELEKSEEALFQGMRTAMFATPQGGDERTGVMIVYDSKKRTIEVMNKAELKEEIKCGQVSGFAFCRDSSLNGEVSLVRDWED